MKTKAIMLILLYVFCISILITISAVQAQGSIIEPEGAIAELWAARYNGPINSYDYAQAIAVDDSGNVYVTGYSNGSGTGGDYATIKYDADGNENWVARYHSPGNSMDYAKAIAIDGSGNVYVTGYSLYGTLKGYATIKYDSSGNELWVARYNGPGNIADRAYALAVDGSGNVYVTGRSYGGSGTSYDYATVKYDSDGNELWVARYNGPGNDNDYAEALAVDGSGNVHVTGHSVGSGTGGDYATVKYDADGTQLWVARYNGPGNSFDRAYALAVDGSGNVHVTGGSSGSGTSYDYATVKYGLVIPDSASIGDNVQFGLGVSVGEDVTIGDDVVIGDWAVIHENVDVEDGAQIGSDVIIEEDVTIGEDVVIGDGVEIGRGTVIKDGAQIGSNVIIGEDVTIGKDAIIGENSTIGDNVHISNGQVVPPGSTIP